MGVGVGVPSSRAHCKQRCLLRLLCWLCWPIPSARHSSLIPVTRVPGSVPQAQSGSSSQQVRRHTPARERPSKGKANQGKSRSRAEARAWGDSVHTFCPSWAVGPKVVGVGVRLSQAEQYGMRWGEARKQVRYRGARPRRGEWKTLWADSDSVACCMYGRCAVKVGSRLEGRSLLFVDHQVIVERTRVPDDKTCRLDAPKRGT